MYTVLDSWWWTVNLCETCRVLYQNKFEKLVHLVDPYLFIFLWHCGPSRAMASSFLRFIGHTQRRITVGRTPLDEWSARRRALVFIIRMCHDTHGLLNVKRNFSSSKTTNFQPFCKKINLKSEIYYRKSLKSKIMYHNYMLCVRWPWIGKRHNFDIAVLRTTSRNLYQ